MIGKNNPESDELEALSKSVGKIGNYYGGLNISTKLGRYYWSIENYDGFEWEEIPKSLFDELNSFGGMGKKSL